MQRSIEIVIGRLATNEEFRATFLRNPEQALTDVSCCGLPLNAIEVSALLATDRSLWDRIASQLDSRLQKASLKVEA